MSIVMAEGFLKNRVFTRILGVIFILAGIAALISYGLVLHLTCTRTDARTACDSHISFMGLIPIGIPHHQPDVLRADLEEACSDIGERITCGYTVEVKSKDEIYQLNGHFFNQASAEELIGNINALKESPANGLMLMKNIQNRSMLALGWLFVAAPLLILGCLLVSPAFSLNQEKSLPTGE
jgi:hypothetical protein